jgi:hypothetical protein
MIDYSKFQLFFEAEDDELDAMLCLLACDEFSYRTSLIYRKRWDSSYLVSLALEEYRLGPKEFDVIHTLIGDRLSSNEQMSHIRGLIPISAASKIGVGLIILAGGRRTEAMRTHGIAESTVYKILHSFCKAVNECPVFDLNYNIDYYTLMKRAEEFYAKSFISLFKYCCGALDGLAIKVNVRSDDTQHVLSFYSTLLLH